MDGELIIKHMTEKHVPDLKVNFSSDDNIIFGI